MAKVRRPDPEYLNLLSRHSKAIQELVLAARKLILEEAPDASEFVYEVYTIAGHFAFTERPSDSFVYTTTHANWVNLGFHFGALLSDPYGLLRGDGKLMRHIRIAQSADLDVSGVRELVRGVNSLPPLWQVSASATTGQCGYRKAAKSCVCTHTSALLPERFPRCDSTYSVCGHTVAIS